MDNANALVQALGAGATLTESFNYTVTDGTLSDTAVLSVSIGGANDAPVLGALSVIGAEDTPVVFTAANFNGVFSDVDTAGLASVKVLTLPASGVLKLGSASVSSGQVISAVELAGLSYVPGANENGAKTFTVSGSDGALDSNTVTVTMNLGAVNDAPVMSSGSVGTVAENAPTSTVIYTAVGNDTVDAGATPTYSLKSGVGDVALVSINASTGAVTLTGSANFEAKASYGFTVVGTDAQGLSAEHPVSVSVSDVNEAPVGVNDTASALESGGTANATAGANPTGNVLSNDTDVDAGASKRVTVIRTGAVEGAGTLGTLGTA